MTKVLVVEDEASYSEALSYMLRKEGFEVAVAEDGHAALAEFSQGLGEILDEHDRHDVERAARGFGERAQEGRAVPLGHHQSSGAEGGGGAERRADILRVGHLVKHQQDAVRIDVVEPDRR